MIPRRQRAVPAAGGARASLCDNRGPHRIRRFPVLLPFAEFTPVLAAPVDCAPMAAIVGRTVAGPGLTLRGYATVRADGEWIRIGANAFFAERATVHIADRRLGAAMGDDVTVGRFALVHACTLGSRVVVGDNAVVMDGASVGDGSLIAAGSLVAPFKQLPGGFVYAGNPAVAVRRIEADELAAAAASIRAGAPLPEILDADLPPLDMASYAAALGGHHGLHPIGGVMPRVARAYVAPTALVAGDVEIADDAGVYFACAVIAGDGRIVIGPRTNVQDNCLFVTDAARGPLVLGAGVTIGHNVRMGAATIHDDALVGMGAQVGDGVVVLPGGCIGARSLVEPGTVVDAGWIWAGRPARAFRAVRPVEREMFASGCAAYVGYGETYLSQA